MESRIVNLSKVELLKDFTEYGIDTEGNVWSFRHNKSKILSPGWKSKTRQCKFVRLTDRYGNLKNFVIHRLLALAFIPTDDISRSVIHKNGDLSDNRLENLEWKTDKIQKEFDGYVLDDFLAKRVKQVYTASIRKGLPVPDTNTFINSIIENSLESYIMQYGLRRLLT